ncbi:MAG: hypothetical protein V2B15_09320 [Bacteroidota bacterium]
MKRFFILAGLFFLCFVFNVRGFAHAETRHIGNIAVESSASDNPIIVSGTSDLFNPSANKENESAFQRLFPTLQKFLYGGLLQDEYAELKKKSEISNYVAIAEYHIVRFEGKDIIHPFNYFW